MMNELARLYQMVWLTFIWLSSFHRRVMTQPQPEGPGLVFCPQLFSQNCASEFPDTPYTCPSSGGCLSNSSLCNGSINCPEVEDELFCCGATQAAPSERCEAFTRGLQPIECSIITACIAPGSVCNGAFECGDRTDEFMCVFPTTMAAAIMTSTVQELTTGTTAFTEIETSTVGTTFKGNIETSTVEITTKEIFERTETSTEEDLLTIEPIANSSSTESNAFVPTTLIATSTVQTISQIKTISASIKATYNSNGWTNGMCFEAIVNSLEKLSNDTIFTWEINGEIYVEQKVCVTLSLLEKITVKLTVEGYAVNGTLSLESTEVTVTNNGLEFLFVVVISTSFLISIIIIVAYLVLYGR